MNHRHEDFQSTALPLSYPGTGEIYLEAGAYLGDRTETVQLFHVIFSSKSIKLKNVLN